MMWEKLGSWIALVALVVQSTACAQAITVVSPNGGETIRPGETYAISWSASGSPGKVCIYLYRNWTKLRVLGKAPASAETWAWTVPADEPIGCDYRIRVCLTTDLAVGDYSDRVFAIGSPSLRVVSPNGAEAFSTGNTAVISWIAQNLSGKVRIYLYRNWTKVRVLADAAVTDGQWSWHIPRDEALGNAYRVRVQSLQNTGINDYGDGLFVIDETSVDRAFRFLREMAPQSDVLVVYRDNSAPENHFVAKGICADDLDCVTMTSGWPSGVHSGDSCIRCEFFRSASGWNWGGWILMNGVLQGSEIQPSLNWGTVPNAGLDLRGAHTLTFWARGERGGEVVEFYLAGIGRDPDSGLPENPYPDSSPKIGMGWVTLTKAWKQYAIDLAGKNLGYCLGGWGWTTNGSANPSDIVFYVDDIEFRFADRPAETGPLTSFATLATDNDFDKTNRNAAWVYDNALAAIVLANDDASVHADLAKSLADALTYGIQHDRFYDDGRIRNSYQGGEIVLWPGWEPHGRVATARESGWWDETGLTWYEDYNQVGTSTGNAAWTALGLLACYDRFGDEAYLDAAELLAAWIAANTYDVRGAGGFTAGTAGWEPDQDTLTYKSTEHNLDCYCVFGRLFLETGDEGWRDLALHARRFVNAMWDSQAGRLYTGTMLDGATINRDPTPMDINAWALLATGDAAKYGASVAWNDAHCAVTADGFSGFDYNADLDGVWLEGSSIQALAYKALNRTENAENQLAEIGRAQIEAQNATGFGIVAASHDGVTTGFDWEYFARRHVGATAWYLLASQGLNPFWNIPIDAPVPEIPSPTLEPVTVTLTYADFDDLEAVCTDVDNWCGWADVPGKAIVFGGMHAAVNVPGDYTHVDATVVIPCNGWGEGLAGPDGSAAHVSVDDSVVPELITSDLSYHHGSYYRYEACESWTDTFDIAGKSSIVFSLQMLDGAHCDFERAELRFYCD